MLPQNSTSEFSKTNYLISSEDSINKREDRFVNRQYDDPFKMERKVERMFDREAYSNANKYNLNTLPLEGTNHMRFDSEPFGSRSLSPYHDDKHLIPSLNYDYDEIIKYKRRERENNINNNSLTNLKKSNEQ